MFKKISKIKFILNCGVSGVPQAENKKAMKNYHLFSKIVSHHAKNYSIQNLPVNLYYNFPLYLIKLLHRY